MLDGGKGSKPRPFSVTQREYETRWDAIFGRDLKEEKQEDTSVLNAYDNERLVSKFDKESN
jgi:arylamine N-acetyltransferase